MKERLREELERLSITEIGTALGRGTLRRVQMRPAASSTDGTYKSPVAE